MAEDLFQQLKEKYVFVLHAINAEDLKVEKLNLDGNKLFIRAVAPSEQAKNKFWDAVKKVNPNFSEDLIAQISVAPAAPAAAAAKAPSPGVTPVGGAAPQPSQPAMQTYTVAKGDTLSAIAKKFYGNANDYMKIFEANRDQLSNPDKIQIGQVLKIPGAGKLS